jgi:hypothetical protein
LETGSHTRASQQRARRQTPTATATPTSTAANLLNQDSKTFNSRRVYKHKKLVKNWKAKGLTNFTVNKHMKEQQNFLLMEGS